MFKGKPTKVILTGKARDEFEKISALVEQEIIKGKIKSTYQTLFESIKQKIELLKENPEYGVHIAKNKIPYEYKQQFDVNNLWKLNLSGAWRMIYTIRGSEIDIISLVIEIMPHKKYDRKFKYKNK